MVSDYSLGCWVDGLLALAPVEITLLRGEAGDGGGQVGVLGEDEFGGDEEGVGFHFVRGAVLGGEQAGVLGFDGRPGDVVAG
jgi:hypothetical protein